jgi:serine/threonine protein kinase
MDDGTPYLVMELLRGETLAARLMREGLPTWTETARLIGQIAAGLQAVHEVGVVHRDLKPANVFLMDAPGQLPLVKLIDFGISTRRRRREDTAPYVLVGTPLYMAPEQARGERNIDHRADQYALAVIAFEMLTGMRPFEGDALSTLVEAIVVESAPHLGAIDPRIPPSVDVAMQRALSKDRGERFETVTDFAKALTAALREGPLSVPPPHSGVRLRRDTLLGDETLVVGEDTEPALSLRPPDSALVHLVRAPRVGDGDVSADIAFIASRLEQGTSTLADLLDVLPVPRREALITVGEMIERGMIEFVGAKGDLAAI